jgi:two-component system response regulator MtrA
MLGIVLNDAGIDVDLVSRGDEALDAFREKAPDLILLDVMLPGIDGVEVCRLIRAQSMVPIIMLTAKGETEDVVRGLEAGADDYIVKPFRHASELVARVRTRLRRTNTDVSGLISIGDLKIDVQAHQLLRDGKQIQLTRLEFDLLVALAREPGRVFTRDALLSEVWGYAHSTDTRLVNVHIQRLRSKIERDPENPEIVITIRGVGYKAGVLVGS